MNIGFCYHDKSLQLLKHNCFNMDISLLSRLGIHSQGIDVYADLLDHGASFVTEISRRTGLERVIIYRRLPELLEKGLLEREVVGKRFRYAAAHPSAFQGILQEMGEGLLATISALELSYRKKSGSAVPKVRVLSGPGSSTKLYTEVARVLPERGTYYRYSSRSMQRDKLSDLASYHRLRDEKRLSRMVITNEDLERVAAKKPDRELVSLPSIFPFKQNFQKIIYADRVAILDIETETICIIESKLLASFEEAIFRCLFNYLRAEKEGRLG